MRLKSLLFVSIAMAVTSAGQESRSASPGPYTQEQADRGKAAYADQCASCHGRQLSGGDEAPALIGGEFLRNWRDRTFEALLAKVQTSMPADRPGTLSKQMNSDIVAFIFAANKFSTTAGPKNEVAVSSSRPNRASADPGWSLTEGQAIDRRPP